LIQRRPPLIEHRVFLIEYRALLVGCRAFWIESSVVLIGTGGAGGLERDALPCILSKEPYILVIKGYRFYGTRPSIYRLSPTFYPFDRNGWGRRVRKRCVDGGCLRGAAGVCV